jgi:peptidyl-prolyl cis-trans isomerase C
LFLFVVVTVIAAGCSKEQPVTEEGAKLTAAKVDDWTMTRAELDNFIESLPENQQGRYSNAEARAELVDKFIEEEVFYQGALKAGYDDDEAVREMMDKYRRSLIVNEFFNREITPRAYPSDQEIHDYYESNEESFTILPIAKAQHIFSTDSLKLVGFKKQIEDGEPMTTLAHKFSEDEATRSDGGNLGYFNPGGYIRGIGFSKELSDAAFSMEPGVVSDPIKWGDGYSLLRVNELRPARLRPYEEVREEIKELLTRQRLEEVKAVAYEELKRNHTITNFVAEEANLDERTPEELWNLAQNSTDPHERLRYYEQIVEGHPGSKYTAEALFMIGFVYAEELKMLPDADRAFTRVVNEYPNREVAETAAWMLKNLNNPLPEFEDLDDLHDKIQEESE